MGNRDLDMTIDHVETFFQPSFRTMEIHEWITLLRSVVHCAVGHCLSITTFPPVTSKVRNRHYLEEVSFSVKLDTLSRNLGISMTVFYQKVFH